MSSAFLSSLFPGVVSGCIYALIGVGFILIRKTSGVFNLAQGQIVIFGAYLFYMVVVTLGIHLWSAVAIVICIGAMIGILIERFLMRPLYGHDLGAAILVTLMAALFIEALLSMGWGTAFLVAPRMFPKEVALSVGSATISYDQLAVVLVTIVIFAVLGLFFSKSRLGIAMMAVSEDPVVAQGLGVRVSRLVGISWALACALGFLGGILITNISGISYTMVEIGIKAIAVAIIGGFESFRGLLLAGILIGVGESLAVAYADPFLSGGSVREILAYVIMIVVLLYKPYGLFGWIRIERV